MGEIVAASSGPDPSWLACQNSLHRTSIPEFVQTVLQAFDQLRVPR